LHTFSEGDSQCATHEVDDVSGDWGRTGDADSDTPPKQVLNFAAKEKRNNMRLSWQLRQSKLD